MLFIEKNHTKHADTFCGQRELVLNVTTGGKYSNHCALKLHRRVYHVYFFSMKMEAPGSSERLGLFFSPCFSKGQRAAKGQTYERV
jgi:hypothetical protein